MYSDDENHNGLAFVQHYHPCVSRQILQRIVSGEDAIAGAEPLYIHSRKVSNDGFRYDTDTYMNIFHHSWWQKLTGMENMALHVTCRGKGRLLLLGAKADPSGNTPFREVAVQKIDSTEAEETHIARLSDDYAFYCLAWEEAFQNSLTILNAVYMEIRQNFHSEVYPAKLHPESDNNIGETNIRMALVVTTYRRIDDITRLVDTYQAACSKSTDFSRSSHLFIVNNEPADRTELCLMSNAHLTFLHSPVNLGGAGGFSRGAREAIMQGGFSHILFMDDDAYTCEEAWLRTLSLLRRLRPPYKDQVVSGAMFTLECPTWCHVIQEALTQKGLGVTLAGKKDLSTPQSVLELIGKVRTTAATSQWDTTSSVKRGKYSLRVSPSAPVRPYAAWWYCVMPVELFLEYGYPLPVFFRGDDQEFSMRIQRLPLPLNGICVWHPAFKNKTNLFRLYLGCRNNAITNLLHFYHWRRNILRTLLRKAAQALAVNNYQECSVRVLAIRDFLEFSSVPHEGERLMRRVRAWSHSFDTSREASTSTSTSFTIKPKRYPGLWFYFGVYLSLGGALIPRCLRRNNVRAEQGDLRNIFPAQCVRIEGEESVYVFSSRHSRRLVLLIFMLLVRVLLCRRQRMTNYFNTLKW
jgi:hypothetical protein